MHHPPAAPDILVSVFLAANLLKRDQEKRRSQSASSDTGIPAATGWSLAKSKRLPDFFSANGAKFLSPGQRPGREGYKSLRPERPGQRPGCIAAFQAALRTNLTPGRWPGLRNSAPLAPEVCGPTPISELRSAITLSASDAARHRHPADLSECACHRSCGTRKSMPRRK